MEIEVPRKDCNNTSRRQVCSRVKSTHLRVGLVSHSWTNRLLRLLIGAINGRSFALDLFHALIASFRRGHVLLARAWNSNHQNAQQDAKEDHGDG